MSDPTRYTAPLVANEEGLPVYSDGYRLIDLVEKHVRLDGKPLVLDVWQRRLLVRLLEKYPPDHEKAGQLRYRQVVVSIPRQAGKSVLASVLGLYGLLQHSHSPKVLGLARGVEQANIVYGLVADSVRGSAALKKRLRTTGTRGITHKGNGGSYKVLPAKPEAVQGYPSTFAICDELHVMSEKIWEAIVTSQRAQVGSLVVGITTAGDINSDLLKGLYEQGAASINAEAPTFGFFCWEAPEGAGLTVEAVTAAHPAVACGRLDAATIIEDERHTKESNWRRYTLNQFWEGQSEPWVPTADWFACHGAGLTGTDNLVWSIDATPGLGHASISVARMNGATVEHEYVASIVKPRIDQLVEIAVKLKAKHGRAVFAMDPYVLGPVAKQLETKSIDVVRIGRTENQQAASLVYSLISRRALSSNGGEILNRQMGNAKTKAVNESFRIVRGTGPIDAVMSMVYASFVASTYKRKGLNVA